MLKKQLKATTKKQPAPEQWTVAVVRRLAAEDVFSLGEDLFAHGHVLSAEPIANGVKARVRDRELAEASIWMDDGFPDYQCSCPEGRGAFCKHCVAAALALIANPKSPALKPAATRKRKLTLSSAEAALLEQDHALLVRKLLALASEDKALASKVLVLAASAKSPLEEEAALRDEIIRLTKSTRFRTAKDVRAYVRGAAEAVRLLEELGTRSRWATVAALVSGTMERLMMESPVYPQYISDIEALLLRLVALFRQACKEAPPPPELRAGAVLPLLTTEVWDLGDPDLESFAELLGDDGLGELERLATARLDKLPSVRAPQTLPLYLRNSRLKNLALAFARKSGDLNRVVDVLSKTLTLPEDFAAIATEFLRAEQPQAALFWISEGLKSCARFPIEERDILTSTLIQTHIELGEINEAVTLVWERFHQKPSLDFYRFLLSFGEGLDEGDAWRAKAISSLKESCGIGSALGPKLNEAFVQIQLQENGALDIFLYENDLESALAAYQRFGGDEEQFARLLRGLMKSFPGTAARECLVEAREIMKDYDDSEYRRVLWLLLTGLRAATKAGIRPSYMAEMNAFIKKSRLRYRFLEEANKSAALAKLRQQGKLSF